MKMNQNRQRAVLFALTTSAIAFGIPLPSQTYGISTASAQTGSQRIPSGKLSEQFFSANYLRAAGQRITRLHLEANAGVRPKRTKMLLDAEIKLYESELTAINAMKGDATLRKHIGKVNEVWLELKSQLGLPFTRQGADLIYSTSEQLYIQTAKITSYLEDAAQSEAGYLADVAGRNAAFAERIAKAAYLFALNKNSGSLVDFETWKKEYTDGLARLEAAELNDDYTRGNLKLGRMMWGFFDNVVTDIVRKQDTTRMLEVSKSVDGMWEIAQSSKKQYEELFRRQSRIDSQFAAQPSRKGS
jgi:hypothetical protein